MPDIAIISDTACDLPQDIRDKYGIETAPLVVRFGTEEYLEHQLTREEFWRKAEQAPPYPQTSQVPVGVFEQAFAKHVEKGQHVLCLTVTSKHSGTFNSACVAAQRFPRQVTVFDTLSLSLVQGYQAIAAAQAAAAGHSVDEIVLVLESIRDRTYLYIALDTIEFLRRGGRADRVMPVLERVVRVLNVKPVLTLQDGQLTLLCATRSREKALQRIQQEVAKQAPAEMLFTLHVRSEDAALGLSQALAEQLDFPLDQIMSGEAGPVLSSHAGPGVLAAAIVHRAV